MSKIIFEVITLLVPHLAPRLQFGTTSCKANIFGTTTCTPKMFLVLTNSKLPRGARAGEDGFVNKSSTFIFMTKAFSHTTCHDPTCLDAPLPPQTASSPRTHLPGERDPSLAATAAAQDGRLSRGGFPRKHGEVVACNSARGSAEGRQDLACNSMGRGGVTWRRWAARSEGGGKSVSYPGSSDGFVGGGEIGEALPQGNVPLLPASINGGANSNGRADWVASRATEEHQLGGAAAHPRGTARCGSAALSSDRDPSSARDPRIWQEGDRWARLTGEVHWNGAKSSTRGHGREYVALSEFLQALSEFVHLLFLNFCW
jgi:hypothetical protein